MFVDMHGKPCAKLVPVSAIDGLLADGAGFAGFAAGPMGQTPVVPGHPGHAGPELVHAGPWQPGLGDHPVRPHVLGEPWPFAPRVILRRQLERLADAGLRPEGRRRGGVLPGPADRRRVASTVADPLDQATAALLRRPGPHPDVRPPDDGVART